MRGRTLHILLGVALSLITVLLAVQGVDYKRVWVTLSSANLLLVGLALLSVCVNILAKAARWKELMGERGQPVPFVLSLRLHLVGQMLNNILPARVGDLSRVYMAGDMGIARAFILGTVAVEKVVDMLCYVLIFGLLLLLMPLPPWVSQPAYVLAVLTMLASGGAVLGLLFRRGGHELPPWLIWLIPHRWRARTNEIVGDGLDSLHILVDGWGTLKVVAWSTLIWFTAMLTNVITLWALAIQVPLAASLFVLFVLVAGINIPAAPGRIGIFEYICILALAVFSVDQTRALSFGVLLHILVYLPLIVGGLIALLSSGWRLGRPMRSSIGESS